MSIQLIVYPQYFNGANPLNNTNQEFCIDGINFATVNMSNLQINIAAPTTVNSINAVSPMTVNTWFRYGSSTALTFESGGTMAITSSGIMQRLSNLSVGVTYNVELNLGILTNDLSVNQYSGNLIQSTTVIPASSLNTTVTVSFTANTTTDIITFECFLGVSIVNSISIKQAPQTPSVVNLSDGQVLLDLYEDEDIPLSLSVDDFKNVAEKVQSYSKAFKQQNL